MVYQTLPGQDLGCEISPVSALTISKLPGCTKPHHDIMVSSYELILGPHELMMRFFATGARLL